MFLDYEKTSSKVANAYELNHEGQTVEYISPIAN